MMDMSDIADLAEDYGDEPWVPRRSPIVRLLIGGGACITVIYAASARALTAMHIYWPLDNIFAWLVLSVASIPVIVYCWSEEVTWRGGKRERRGKILAVSILSWLAELLISALIFIAFPIILY
jgi:hypothetical protein